MKFVYRFLLYFLVAFICLIGGMAVGVRYFDNTLAVKIFSKGNATDPVYEPIAKPAASVEVKAFVEPTINNETLYILEEYDIANNTTTRQHLEMPAKYIGKGKEVVGELVDIYNLLPSRKDKLNDFVTQSLVYFSSDKIIVRKSYNLPNMGGEEDVEATKEKEPLTGYYVTTIDSEIVSYKADKRTVYSRPGILAKNLPTDIQAQLEGWSYFETLEQLEEYLKGLGNLMESLTS